MLEMHFIGNTKLKKIPEGLRNLSSSSSYLFSNCINLTEIPAYAQQLFERTDNWFKTNKTTVLSYIFNNCNNIKSIDDSIYLPSTVIDFAGFFFNCTSLTNLPLSFWPENYETDEINVSNICNNCINLTSYIPAELLWGNLNIKWNCTNAFKNCTNISNISEIPKTWK